MPRKCAIASVVIPFEKRDGVWMPDPKSALKFYCDTEVSLRAGP